MDAKRLEMLKQIANALAAQFGPSCEVVVGIGNINNWEADPYKGYETDDIIYGRGGFF